MERLKLAISKAREHSAQLRQEPSRTPFDGVPPTRPAPARARTFAEPRRSSWVLVVPLLLGLGGLIAFWAMRTDSGAATVPATAQESATPAPPAAAASTLPVSESVPATTVAVAATAAATEADKPEAKLNEQVEAAVEAWRQAWSARNMRSYLGAYSESFRPAGGLSRKDWLASRYRNVGGRKSIDVQIKDLQVLALENGRARVSFLQDYTSGSTRETGQPKTLDLVRDADDRWRIVGEWQDDPPPFADAGNS